MCSHEGSDGKLALLVNLSGTIRLDELPAEAAAHSTVYELAPVAPAQTGPGVIDSPVALEHFEETVRRFLADLELRHGKPERIALFGAVPVAAAVTLGRVLMPNVSPAWAVYDRDDNGQFFLALEVRR